MRTLREEQEKVFYESVVENSMNILKFGIPRIKKYLLERPKIVSHTLVL